MEWRYFNVYIIHVSNMFALKLQKVSTIHIQTSFIYKLKYLLLILTFTYPLNRAGFMEASVLDISIKLWILLTNPNVFKTRTRFCT